MVRARPRPRFEIWQIGPAIHSVDHPARLAVLRRLEQGPATFTQLVAVTRKAKSTLSALHVRPLVASGLIEEAPDRRDSRVKVYRLLGQRLGTSDVDAPRLRDAVLSYVQSRGALPLGTLLGVVEPHALLASGARAEYTRSVARRIGEVLGRLLTSRTLPRAAKELGTLLEAAGLATVATSGAGGRPRVEAHEEGLQSFVASLAEAALAVPLGTRVRLAAPGDEGSNGGARPRPHATV